MKKTNTKRTTKLGQKRAKKASKRKELVRDRKLHAAQEKLEKKKKQERDMQEYIQKILASRRT